MTVYRSKADMHKLIDDAQLRREWSSLPGQFTSDAVRKLYADSFAGHFHPKDIAARIKAKNATTFSELHDAVELSRNIPDIAPLVVENVLLDACRACAELSDDAESIPFPLKIRFRLATALAKAAVEKTCG